MSGTTEDPIDFSAGTSIGSIALTATISKNGSSTAYDLADLDISAGTTIGGISVTGKASAAQADDFNVTAGGSIAGITVKSLGNVANGSLIDSVILAGQATLLTSNAMLAKAGIGYVTLTGSLIGASAVPDPTIGAYGNIGAVSIGGTMMNESLVAGINSGSDGVLYDSDDYYNRNASIASVTVKGAFSSSSIVAGIKLGNDGYWGGATDVEGISSTGVTDKSKIGAIKLGASTVAPSVKNPFGAPASGIEQCAIESPDLTSVQIGNLKSLTNFMTSHWIDVDETSQSSSDTTVAEISV